MASIELTSLVRRFGQHTVLHGADLSVRDGEFVSLLGPSGCGKSTILRLIAGLDQPDAGSIRLGGEDITKLLASRRDIAMVFQSYALYPYLTVRENIAMPMLMRQMSRWQRLPGVARLLPSARKRRGEIDGEVKRAAEAVAIEALLERKPAQLSGGQRQRVALARAMVRNPRAFLLDEPLSNLDAHLRLQMRQEIAALHRRLGATFVYVTHDQEEAMALSDRVAVMQSGRILQVGSPSELYERPDSLSVAAFIGHPKMNLLPAVCGPEGCLELADLATPIRLPQLAGRAFTLGFRPEAATIEGAAAKSPAGDGASLALNLAIDRCEYLGAMRMHALRTASGDTMRLSTPASGPVVGSGQVTVRIALGDLHCFDPDGSRIEVSLGHAALRKAAA